MERDRGSGDEGSHRQQNGRPGRGGRQQRNNAGDDNSAFTPSDLHDDDDPRLRKEIRSRYRDLINSIQQNREEMLSPSNNRLTEVLEEANSLFNDVRQSREAALDAQLLVLASDLGKEKASQMLAEGSAFDTSTFAERLLSFMGLNRLEDGEDDNNGGASDGYFPPDAWHKLARRAECCFQTAPSFHYMRGSFHAEPPPPKQKIVRQSKAPNKQAKRVMPTQLKKMDECQQEATEKEVERILAYLRGYHKDDPTSPILYYEFVIDPNSFSRTVENIFHTSFLVRDGLARLYLDDDKLPCIVPVEEGDVEAGASSSRQQCIISMSPKFWKELIEALDISDTMIQPPST